MILDSSYLFDLTSNDPDAFHKGVEISERGEIQWVPTPVISEADDRSGGDCGIGPNDAYVGATANLLDETVLTANVADFEKLGVPVVTY